MINKDRKNCKKYNAEVVKCYDLEFGHNILYAKQSESEEGAE